MVKTRKARGTCLAFGGHQSVASRNGCFELKEELEHTSREATGDNIIRS